MANDTELWQVRQDGIGTLCANTAKATQEPALPGQVRFVIAELVDCGFDRDDLGIEVCDQIED